MPVGRTTVDFGVWPGSSHATVDITGQTAITGTSFVEAWLEARDTADHSADEHVVANIKVIAGPPTAGAGFTIHALDTNPLAEPLTSETPSTFRPASTTVHGGTAPSKGGLARTLTGTWNVAWVWQ